MIQLSGGVLSAGLLALRIAPPFAVAPPFTLVRIPATFRVLMSLGLAATLVVARPSTALLSDLSTTSLLQAGVREIALGMLFVLILQLLFGALYLAGRTIDVQAGFGLALLIDPTTRTQTPLVGTLFAYAAAAIFFAADGHIALLRLIASTLDVIPLGSWNMPVSLSRLTTFIAAIFSLGLGFAGAAILTIFLIDITIAFLSRTVPQMNVLVLGFQIKTLALLLSLPIVFGFASALLVRMLAITVNAIAELPS